MHTAPARRAGAVICSYREDWYVRARGSLREILVSFLGRVCGLVKLICGFLMIARCVALLFRSIADVFRVCHGVRSLASKTHVLFLYHAEPGARMKPCLKVVAGARGAR